MSDFGAKFLKIGGKKGAYRSKTRDNLTFLRSGDPRRVCPKGKKLEKSNLRFVIGSSKVWPRLLRVPFMT
jgi:hypothetical protein